MYKANKYSHFGNQLFLPKKNRGFITYPEIFSKQLEFQGLA
jgi:hypothetical protein